MVLSVRNNLKASDILIVAAMLLLLTGMSFGLIGSLQYVIPGFLKTYLSFEKVRPLHVSSVVFWIILSALGVVLTYLHQHTIQSYKFERLLKLMSYTLIATVIIILITYLTGTFGGREYWEFHPVLSLPIIICLVIFLFTIVTNIQLLKKQPVYVWMWFTGAVFFLFTFLESYLWIFPYFRNHVITDITIQWKSYGSMVGSWNMLIYGSGIFLIDKISGNNHFSTSRIAFTLYFIGLFNLMFNWGHHIYTLPTHQYVKHISYAVSMTELLIIGRIIYKWRSSLGEARKNANILSYRFLIAADIWIFLTLLLAIMMSVPAINIYTHGTHITVAHTMGATIGINTMMLLAMVTDISGIGKTADPKGNCNLTRGIYIANLALFVFWIALITAGVIKSQWQMSEIKIPFGEMMNNLRPAFVVFMISGGVMISGIMMTVIPLLRKIINPLNS